ncbi:NAD(P)-dependent oxidoreductase [Niabella sp. CC-SYL272]|uniref:NAD(P)-dependent oxidoreductase n=1 Tax=Niabella agricola TaxID=2891571 RepID=UPI001F1E5DC8|nr:NAD(P)-dependent oxidoreductase [Niabella agricola]MCF3107767.1 NAD(P)-dependent oxidoreductase [Niabella agricola]
MKIVIIGATGFVGSAILKEAAQRGHTVTALARNTSTISNTGGPVKTIDIDVANETALAAAIRGNDVVISAFNAGWTNPNLYNDYLSGAQHIEAAVAASGVKRLIVIGGAGSLEIDGTQLVDGPDFPEAYRAGAKGARDYLTQLRANKQLDWTFFSPAIEMNPGITTGRTGHYRLGTDAPVFDANGRSSLSVEDVAVVILDEAEKPAHTHQRFTAGY